MTKSFNYYPYGGLMGESTGSDAQPYKYNGKELDRHSGLDWYDYGARWYNGISWMNPDPHAESYYDVSPYAYCHNNPVNRVDVDGKEDFMVSRNGFVTNSTSILERIKSFFGFSKKEDRVFDGTTGNLIASYPENTIHILKNDKKYTMLEIKDTKLSSDLYHKIIDLSYVEWSRIVHGDNSSLSTTLINEHKNDEVSSAAKIMNDYEKKGEKVPLFQHSHPIPTGINPATVNLPVYLGPSDEDIKTAENHPNTKFVVDDLYNKKTYYYNEKGVYK